MPDDEGRIPACPQGGKVSIHTETPVRSGLIVECSTHGELRGGGSMRDALVEVYRHAGVQPPYGRG